VLVKFRTPTARSAIIEAITSQQDGNRARLDYNVSF